jgi:hypothetical protein
MGHKKTAFSVFVRKPEGERDRWGGRLDVVLRVILKCILEKYDDVVYTGSIWLRVRTSDGH